jgi:DNA-binding NarL/FixJ family response regulator
MELSEKAREIRNQYQREWKRNNPDKLREYNTRYWEKKATNITPEMRVKELHLQGFTQREISQMLNISLGTVNNYLNQK